MSDKWETLFFKDLEKLFWQKGSELRQQHKSVMRGSKLQCAQISGLSYFNSDGWSTEAFSAEMHHEISYRVG